MSELVVKIDEYYPFYERIAREIGGEIEVQDIATLVQNLEQEEYLVHGVKNGQSLSGIREEGILPLSPEGGWVSYWATGLEVFTASSDPESRLFGYDSCFFDHGRSGILALANRKLLNRAGIIAVNQGKLVTIKAAVPVNLITILHATTASFPTMFQLLEQAVQGRYGTGQYVRL